MCASKRANYQQPAVMLTRNLMQCIFPGYSPDVWRRDVGICGSGRHRYLDVWRCVCYERSTMHAHKHTGISDGERYGKMRLRVHQPNPERNTVECTNTHTQHMCARTRTRNDITSIFLMPEVMQVRCNMRARPVLAAGCKDAYYFPIAYNYNFQTKTSSEALARGAASLRFQCRIRKQNTTASYPNGRALHQCYRLSYVPNVAGVCLCETMDFRCLLCLKTNA